MLVALWYNLCLRLLLEFANVLQNQVVDDLHHLSCRGPQVDVEGQAVPQELLDQEMSGTLLVIHAKVFLEPVDSSAPDVVLDLSRVLAVKWISLRCQVVKAAT